MQAHEALRAQKQGKQSRLLPSRRETKRPDACLTSYFWSRGPDSNRRPSGYEHVSFVSGRLVSPVSETVIPDRRRICYLVPSTLSGRALCLSPRFPPDSSKSAFSVPPSQCLYRAVGDGQPDGWSCKHAARPARRARDRPRPNPHAPGCLLAAPLPSSCESRPAPARRTRPRRPISPPGRILSGAARRRGA